jgi:predicted DsbA family dithiol-disulfide isomerase
MHAEMWFDYVCPWAYLGRDRTALMRELGVEVTVRPYELHPEIPKEGATVREGGRLARVFEHVGQECHDLGIPFTPPTRSRNSRLALEAVEVVRATWSDAHEPLDAALACAYWVEGRDISAWPVVGELIEQSGAPVDEVFDAVADGVGARALQSSMSEARDRGVTATPAWWIADSLLIPGAQPREAIERWVTRLLAKEQPPSPSASEQP